MRIAYVLADAGIPVTGDKGASVHVREMVRALAADHEVDLFCAQRGSGTYDLPTATLHVLPAPERRKCATPDIERDRLRLETAARLLCLVESVHQERSYDMLYERYSLFSDVGASMATSHSVPFLLEINAPLILERGRVEALPLALLAHDIERYVFQCASVIVAVSSAIERYVSAQGAREERIHVLPNGVDTERFSSGISGSGLRAELGLNGKFVVGFAGSLKAWHGVDILIDAFSQVRADDWALLIVGDGPERTHIDDQIRGLSLENVAIRTGAVPHTNMPQYLAAMDVALAPYRPVDDFYFSPLKLFEYLAMGKPVIASDIGQVSDIVQHDSNGYLVPSGEVEPLAIALRSLAENPELRQRMSQWSLGNIQTWSTIARRAISFMDEAAILGQHRDN